MVKLTRNSYKRKIILFGVLIFTSIALISTGFAAWIMSANASKDKDGNINVGQVVDSSLTITTPTLSVPSLTFEPEKNDNSGRVRGDGILDDIRTVIVEADISPLKYLKTLTVKFVVPEGIQKAVELGYLVLPTDYIEGKVITGYDVNSESPYHLKETITIAWGDTFGGMNPGRYYDEHETGKTIDLAIVKTNLENLRACVYGYYNELIAPGANRADVIENHKNDEAPKFTIIIEAKAD